MRLITQVTSLDTSSMLLQLFCINNEGVLTGLQDFPKRWTAVIKHNGDYIEGL
jgi:hypothetical protein